MKRLLPTSLVCVLALVPASAVSVRAEDEKTYTLVIKDHKFEPSTLEVPANLKFKILIKNMDSTPEEFEMTSPKREKVVKGGQEGTISLGPFKPGSYEFVGEYHSKTARGRIVAK
jgi:hypothetical protein